MLFGFVDKVVSVVVRTLAVEKELVVPHSLDNATILSGNYIFFDTSLAHWS